VRGELGPEALRSDMTGDVTGRPGVTVRVPYESDGAETTADLTFDVDTGMLLQRVIRHAAGPGSASPSPSTLSSPARARRPKPNAGSCEFRDVVGFRTSTGSKSRGVAKADVL
jgi:hypothetical protein